jgi:hypothetical protein
MNKLLNKYVSENFENIKSKFIRDEIQIIESLDIESSEIKRLTEIMLNSMNISTTEELINVINERSIGIDLNDDIQCEELLNMLKNILAEAK